LHEFEGGGWDGVILYKKKLTKYWTISIYSNYSGVYEITFFYLYSPSTISDIHEWKLVPWYIWCKRRMRTKQRAMHTGRRSKPSLSTRH